MNVPFFTQLLVKGIVIVIAVSIDSLKQKRITFGRRVGQPRVA